MLYGRRLDESLAHVEGSRYALVHAVAKRARQITLWLTADPTELRAESAPPPVAGEFISRDPVALAETEIIQGEVLVRWDPEGRADERELPEASLLPTDPLLLDTLGEEEDELEVEEEPGAVTPALAQALDAEAETDADEEDEEDEADDEADDEDGVDAVEDVDVDDADAVDDTEVLDESDDDLLEVPLQDVDDEEDDEED